MSTSSASIKNPGSFKVSHIFWDCETYRAGCGKMDIIYTSIHTQTDITVYPCPQLYNMTLCELFSKMIELLVPFTSASGRNLRMLYYSAWFTVYRKDVATNWQMLTRYYF